MVAVIVLLVQRSLVTVRSIPAISTAAAYFTLSVLLSVSCHQVDAPTSVVAEYVYTVPQQLSDGWTTASMLSEGMDVGPMIRLMDFLRGRPDNYLQSILVVKDGKLVFEEYFPGMHFDFDNPLTPDSQVKFFRTGFGTGILHMQSSVSKSFTSALVGPANHRTTHALKRSTLVSDKSV